MARLSQSPARARPGEALPGHAVLKDDLRLIARLGVRDQFSKARSRGAGGQARETKGRPMRKVAL